MTTSTNAAATGTIAALYRYPVKSMQGTTEATLTVTSTGVGGDRSWGLLDLATDRLASAKRFSALLAATGGDGVVTLPGGTEVDLTDPGADAALSAWLGRDVRVVRAPDSVGLHYQMTFDPPDDDAELVDIPVPTGTLVDLAALHLCTTATLAHCAASRPDLDWDVRRFRPNVVVDLDAPPFAEDGWVGRELHLGSEVVLRVLGPTVRCAMPLRAQPGGLSRQPTLTAAMEALNTRTPNHLGIYLEVVTPGAIAVGDVVTLG